MLFQVYGETAMFQWLGWVAVFACLILVNEVARRSKAEAFSASWRCPPR